MKINNNLSNTFKILTCAMLLIAPFDLPYAFYQLLRWLTCLTCIDQAYKYSSSKFQYLTPSYSLIAILYNPLAPITLEKEAWIFINIAIFIFLIHKDLIERNIEIKSVVLKYLRKLKLFTIGSLRNSFKTMLVFIFTFLILAASVRFNTTKEFFKYTGRFADDYLSVDITSFVYDFTQYFASNSGNFLLSKSKLDRIEYLNKSLEVLENLKTNETWNEALEQKQLNTKEEYDEAIAGKYGYFSSVFIFKEEEDRIKTLEQRFKQANLIKKTSMWSSKHDAKLLEYTDEYEELIEKKFILFGIVLFDFIISVMFLFRRKFKNFTNLK
jgi:hypothetical protein